MVITITDAGLGDNDAVVNGSVSLVGLLTTAAAPMVKPSAVRPPEAIVEPSAGEVIVVGSLEPVPPLAI